MCKGNRISGPGCEKFQKGVIFYIDYVYFLEEGGKLIQAIFYDLVGYFYQSSFNEKLANSKAMVFAPI